MKKWSRTPKHIMRRKCVEYVIKDWPPSSFIEFGAGTGDMTNIFLNKGYTGICYDIGSETRKTLRKNLEEFVDQVVVIDDFQPIQNRQFDYLFAFEVLEHIKNDAQELTTWSSYLKPGGRILITVPAHKNKFGREDEAVGHIRRYEKLELRQLLEESGYDNIKILNMGFPLGNLTRIIGKLFVKNKKSQTGSQEEKSIKSGLERTEAVNKLSFLFNSITLLPFNFLQILFFDKDWGDGYVAHATRKHIGT